MQGVKFHYATFASAVHGFGATAELRRVRREMAAQRKDGGAPLAYVGPRLPRHESLFWCKPLASWCFPFLGADVSIVRRSQRALIGTSQPVNSDADAASRIVPLQYSAYMTLPSLWAAGIFLLYGTIFRILAGFSWGRKLLLAYPGE